MTKTQIRRTMLNDRNHRGKEFTSNAMAVKAATKAKAQGWKAWTELNQSDVLDWATTVTQKPGTNWFFVGQWVEDAETIYKVQGKLEDVLEYWLSHTNALEPNY